MRPTNLRIVVSLAIAAAIQLAGIISSKAEVREAASLSEIVPYVNSTTLVVFDIDNTIAEAAQTLGSVQWQEWEIERGILRGLTPSKAREESIARFSAVNLQSEMRLVEADTTRGIVNLFQTKAAAVMALTARPLSLRDRTPQQLIANGVSLKGNAPLGRKIDFIEKVAAHYNGEGIVFAAPDNDKGRVLEYLIRQPDFKSFTKIVFIDDKLKYAESVDRAITAMGIPVVAFRYGAADFRVKKFDPVRAAVQWHEFAANNLVIQDQEVIAENHPVGYSPESVAVRKMETNPDNEPGYLFKGCETPEFIPDNMAQAEVLCDYEFTDYMWGGHPVTISRQAKHILTRLPGGGGEEWILLESRTL